MPKLYVAYGSNLNKEQMSRRCPTAKFVGTGIIENYELQFKGSLHNAHATISPKEGASVPVGIWKIQKLDERRLDVYEGYPSYYFKQDIKIRLQQMCLGMSKDLMLDKVQQRPFYCNNVLAAIFVLRLFLQKHIILI